MREGAGGMSMLRRIVLGLTGLIALTAAVNASDVSRVVAPKIQANKENASIGAYRKPYTFSTNWFTHKIPTWTQILKDLKGKPDINYLEIGTFEGRSALWVLENIATHPTARLTIIDAFEEEGSYRTFTSNIELSGDTSKFKILRGFSTEKIREVPENSVDLAYIDGSGKGIVMLTDLVNTWNALKAGGIIICSRYALNDRLREDLELEPNDPGPIETLDAFLKLYKPYIKLVAFEQNQVIFQKTRQ
jgi:hypothetical protein